MTTVRTARGGVITLTKASEITKRRVTFLWDKMVPRFALSVWPGPEGCGKSTVAAWVIARLTRGELKGAYLDRPQRCAVLSPEDGFAEAWTGRLEGMNADTDMVSLIGYKSDPESEDDGTPLSLPRDLDDLMEALREGDVSFLWIDGLVNALDEDTNTDSYKSMSGALNALQVAAERNHITICGGWHYNKSDGTAMRRVMGSRALRTASRAIIAFAEDPQRGEVVLAVDKANGFDYKTSPPMRYSITGHSFDDAYEEDEDGTLRRVSGSIGVIEKMYPGEGNGHEVLAQLLAQQSEALKREVGLKRVGPTPADWLSDYLSQRPEGVMKAEVMQDASAHGFSEDQVKRAARALQVPSRPEVTVRQGSTPLRGARWFPCQIARTPGVIEVDFSHVADTPRKRHRGV